MTDTNPTNLSLAVSSGGVHQASIFTNTDTTATPGTIAKASEKGLRVGDFVLHRQFGDLADATTFTQASIHMVTAIDATTDDGTVSAGTVIG